VITVLDTNVVISALLFRGSTAAIYRAVLESRVIPLLSPPILNEYVRVLSYPKLGLTDADIRYLVDEEIRPWFPMLTERIPLDTWIAEDPADDHLVNAARVRPNTFLVSGDRHIIGERDRLTA
jgi:uncharacterized protein